MSDDYIKRVDAIELIARHDDTDGTINVFSGRFVNELISAVPPADVVEIVRCKDCKHYISDGGALMICEITEMNTNDCDYCSYGERKDEGL